MLSFSERYKADDLIQVQVSRGFKVQSKKDENKPNNYDIFRVRERTRLKELVKHHIHTQHGLQNYFYKFNHDGSSIKYLKDEQVGDTSRRLFGYSLIDLIDLDTLEARQDYYADGALCDLLEFVLLFSKKASQKVLHERIQNLFDEAQIPILVEDSRLIVEGTTGLSSVISLIKDPVLKSKIEGLNSSKGIDAKSAANLSADALQNLYSSEEGQDKTKSASEETCSEIAKKLSIDRQEDLASLLSDTVSLAKRWNNNLADIRHTDRHKIYLIRPNLYNIPATLNEALVELTVGTLQDKLLNKLSSADIINRFCEDWTVDLNQKDFSEEIDLSEIPF